MWNNCEYSLGWYFPILVSGLMIASCSHEIILCFTVHRLRVNKKSISACLWKLLVHCCVPLLILYIFYILQMENHSSAWHRWILKFEFVAPCYKQGHSSGTWIFVCGQSIGCPITSQASTVKMLINLSQQWSLFHSSNVYICHPDDIGSRSKKAHIDCFVRQLQTTYLFI